jgi:hypothetical protein
MLAFCGWTGCGLITEAKFTLAVLKCISVALGSVFGSVGSDKLSIGIIAYRSLSAYRSISDRYR